jgi:hypothetical protein
MKLQYLKSWALAELQRAGTSTPANYSLESPWINELFGDRNYLATSRLDVKELPELIVPTSDSELFELENTVILHSALRNLNRSQAADDRLWSWLAHGPYWQYMRKRWPISEESNKVNYVREHYFLGGARSLVRHGLARLWWFGQATYMPEAADPYVLTKLLLETTDARQSIMERQFWRNQRILHPFLRRIAHWRDRKIDMYTPRERFRGLCKMMNLVGGASVLDALAAKDIGDLVDRFAAQQQPSGAPTL